MGISLEYDQSLAKSRWEECQSAYDVLYDEMQEDWEFSHGVGQWDDVGAANREKQGRPCLVLNQLAPYVKQVTNDIRQTRLAIRVTPVDTQADIDTAEVLSGIIRNIEVQSGAQTAYITAAANAVGAGLGWLRVYTDYADEESFDQEIFIDRVLDFTSVYLDPAFKKLDGSDAEYAFIRKDYTKEEFERNFPDADPVSFDGKAKDDSVCVVEYFERCYKKSKIYQIVVSGQEKTITQEQKDTLDEDGTVAFDVINERDVNIPYVMRRVLNGAEEPIEEDEFPSKYIPLIPVIGEEVYINGRHEFHSLIRQGKDAQKLYNYWKSASAEIIALQPKAPWTGVVGSFASYPNKWETSNVENYAFLEYDLVYDENGQRVEPPTRAQPVQGSPAMMQEAMYARDDIRLAIGMPQENMGQNGNTLSGVAIRNRQIEGDNSTYHFIDNLSNSLAFLGRILVDMIPRLYSKRKVTRILGEGDKEKNIPINTPFVKENGQERAATPRDAKIDGIYRLDVGKYDVVCDVGASYSSKRQETADKLVQLIQAQPELMSVTGDLLFEALDLPMANEIAKRLKASIDPALLGEDPMAEKLKAAAMSLKQAEQQLMNYDAALKDKKENEENKYNVELKKLEIDAVKTKADVDKTYAEIEKMRAETKGFNIDAVMALGNAVNGIAAQVDDIGSALNIMLDAKEGEENERETSEHEKSDAMTQEVENPNE